MECKWQSKDDGIALGVSQMQSVLIIEHRTSLRQSINTTSRLRLLFPFEHRYK
jgi:hypothetical protein